MKIGKTVAVISGPGLRDYPLLTEEQIAAGYVAGTTQEMLGLSDASCDRIEWANGCYRCLKSMNHTDKTCERIRRNQKLLDDSD